MRDRRKRTLTAAVKRVLASAGLVITRYKPDGERATVQQFVPEASGRPSLFCGQDQTIVRTWARKETESVDERADIELDRLITKRYDARDGDTLLEPTYAESVRRYNAKLQAALREEWAEYHRLQAERHRATLERLIQDHERRAEQLCEEGE